MAEAPRLRFVGVMPAQAGIQTQGSDATLDSCLRRNDKTHGCTERKTGRGAGRRSILRQHALQDAIAFDQPMIERARDMERDDHPDQNPTNEVPDENAV